MSRSPIESVTARLLVVPLPAYMHFFGYRTVNVPLVRVRDTDGVASTGFAYTLDAGAGMVCRMVEDVIAPQLLGKEPTEWNAMRIAILSATRRLGASMFTAALSAVDIAIWDLRAIRAGRPLYEILGGERRPVPIYGSGRSGQEMTTVELVDNSIRYIQEGYAGVKIALGALGPEKDLARVRAVRDAIGPNVELMVDGSERFTLDDALWIGRQLETVDVRWFEEPLPAEDVSGYAMLAGHVGVPIATGEHLQGAHAFVRYLRETEVSLYQPDAALGGGISEMQVISALASANNRPLAWHSLADLHVHLAVSSPMTKYVEDFPILSGVLEDPLVPSDGVILPPDRPGHGMVWDEDKVNRASEAALC